VQKKLNCDCLIVRIKLANGTGVKTFLKGKYDAIW